MRFGGRRGIAQAHAKRPKIAEVFDTGRKRLKQPKLRTSLRLFFCVHVFHPVGKNIECSDILAGECKKHEADR